MSVAEVSEQSADMQEPQCPQIFSSGPQPEEKHQISFIMCKASVKMLSRQNPGLAQPPYLNPVLSQRKQQLAVIKY